MKRQRRPEAIAAGCAGKASFPTFALAAEMRQRRERSRVSAPRMPYHCPTCHLWHLGGVQLGGDRARDRTLRDLAQRRDARRQRRRERVLEEED